MTDDNNPAVTVPDEAARLERVAAVETQRIADDRKAAERRERDRVRKADSRARQKDELARAEQAQAERLAAEQASRDAERIARERIENITYELSGDARADFGEPTESETAKLAQDIDDYLQQYRHESFEKLYIRLSLSKVGVLILRHFGIDPLPTLPEGWRYHDICGELNVVRMPGYLPRFAVWEGKTPEDLETHWTQYRGYYENLSIKPPTSPKTLTVEQQHSFRQHAEHSLEDHKETVAEQKRKYREKMSEYERKFKSWRAV